MSLTNGTSEPTVGAQPGAIPQPPPGLPREPVADTPESFSRGGDTEVVFRLERDVPLVGRVRALAAETVDRLFESWRMVAAVGVGLVAVVVLASVVGGAYGHRPPPAPPTAVAAPAIPPPAPLPAAVEPAAPVVAPAPTAAVEPLPARPARVRTHPARRGSRATAHRKAEASPRHRPGTPPAQRPR